jgi:hypothetical protein
MLGIKVTKNKARKKYTAKVGYSQKSVWLLIRNSTIVIKKPAKMDTAPNKRKIKVSGSFPLYPKYILVKNASGLFFNLMDILRPNNKIIIVSANRTIE